MYPTGELDALGARKAIVQARIAQRRYACVRAAEELAKPLALVDRGLALWRSISPLVKLAGIPLGLLAVRLGLKHTRGGGKLSGLLSALPLVLRGARLLRQMRAGAGVL